MLNLSLNMNLPRVPDKFKPYVKKNGELKINELLLNPKVCTQVFRFLHQHIPSRLEQEDHQLIKQHGDSFGAKIHGFYQANKITSSQYFYYLCSRKEPDTKVYSRARSECQSSKEKLAKLVAAAKSFPELIIADPLIKIVSAKSNLLVKELPLSVLLSKSQAFIDYFNAASDAEQSIELETESEAVMNTVVDFCQTNLLRPELTPSEIIETYHVSHMLFPNLATLCRAQMTIKVTISSANLDVAEVVVPLRALTPEHQQDLLSNGLTVDTTISLKTDRKKVLTLFQYFYIERIERIAYLFSLEDMLNAYDVLKKTFPELASFCCKYVMQYFNSANFQLNLPQNVKQDGFIQFSEIVKYALSSDDQPLLEAIVKTLNYVTRNPDGTWYLFMGEKKGYNFDLRKNLMLMLDGKLVGLIFKSLSSLEEFTQYFGAPKLSAVKMIDIRFKTISAKIGVCVEFLKNACPNCEGIRLPSLYFKSLNELIDFLSAKRISFINRAVYGHRYPLLKRMIRDGMLSFELSQMKGALQGLTTFQTKFEFFLNSGIGTENDELFIARFRFRDSMATDEILMSNFLKKTTSLDLVNCPNFKSTGWQWLLRNNEGLIALNLGYCEGLSARDLSLIGYQQKLKKLSLTVMPQLTDEILNEVCHSLGNSIKILIIRQCKGITKAGMAQLKSGFPSLKISFFPYGDSTLPTSSSSHSLLGKHSLEDSKEAEAKRLRRYEKGEME